MVNHIMILPENIYLKHSIYFIVLAILFSWPGFFIIDTWIFPNLMKEGESIKALFFVLGGHVFGMFGPSIAAIILLKFVIKSRFPPWQWGPPKYYVWGSIFMLTTWLLPALTGLLVSSFKIRISIETFQLIYMGIYIGIVWFAGIGEEFGWSSFLLSYLSPEFGKTRTIIISGIYRGIWHFPVLISPVLYKVIIGEQSIFILLLLSIGFIIQLIISNILFSSLFGYLWYKTESTALLGWLHYMFDLVRDFLTFFIIGFGESIFAKFGFAIVFYGVAYYCLDTVMREEGIRNIFRFVLSKEFREI